MDLLRRVTFSSPDVFEVLCNISFAAAFIYESNLSPKKICLPVWLVGNYFVFLVECNVASIGLQESCTGGYIIPASLLKSFSAVDLVPASYWRLFVLQYKFSWQSSALNFSY